MVCLLDYKIQSELLNRKWVKMTHFFIYLPGRDFRQIFCYIILRGDKYETSTNC